MQGSRKRERLLSSVQPLGERGPRSRTSHTPGCFPGVRHAQKTIHKKMQKMHTNIQKMQNNQSKKN
jgi:hypothetical protein